MTTPEYSRLDELFDAACNDTITTSEIAELETILSSDPALRRAYDNFMQMNFQLHFLSRARRADAACDQETGNGGQEKEDREQKTENRSQESEEGKQLAANGSQQTASSPTPRSKKSWLDRASKRPTWPALAITVLIMVSVVGWMAVTYLPERVAESGGKDADTRQPAGQPEFVAWLMKAHKTQWIDGTEPQKTKLMPGQRLAISKGLIEIQYRTRAVVVIEGPAEFYVGTKKQGTAAELARKKAGRGSLSRSEEGTEAQRDEEGTQHSSLSTQQSNSGYLALGKLVARCGGKKAKGFTIDTPVGAVEDLGTEFGVDVDTVGSAEVHVFAGFVRLKSSAGNATGATLVLGKDESARIEADSGRIAKVDEDNATYVRTLPASGNPSNGIEPISDDFDTVVPDRYRLSQAYGKGGVYKIEGGKLRLRPGPGNTMTVMLADGRHGLGVGMRAMIDAPAHDLDSGSGQFFLVSTIPFQASSQSGGFSFRLRRDGYKGGFRVGAGADMQILKAKDPGGPLRLIIERQTQTTLRCYYQIREEKPVPLGEYTIPEFANRLGLYVGVQAWLGRSRTAFAFDDLKIEATEKEIDD